MRKSALLRSKYERFERSLSKTIGDFRSGRDRMGLATFLDSAADIDDIVQTCLYLREYEPISDLLPSLRELHAAVQNEDVVAMTDILEYTLLPFAQKTLEGTDPA